MKKLLFALLLFALTASAVNVTWYFQSANTNAQAVRSMYLYLTAPYTNGGGAIVTWDRIIASSSTNGAITISNLYGGTNFVYRGEFQGTYKPTTNWYVFPDTNGFVNAADWAFPLTNGSGIVAYSRAQADARFLTSGGTGNAAHLTNAGLSLVTNAAGPATGWVWLASQGKEQSDPDSFFGVTKVGLMSSPDGTNWNRVGIPAIYDPDEYTNNFNGPFAREWALFWTNGQYWAVYNYDPYNVGGGAQGLGLARSCDLTNWVRETILYPFGTTNTNGCMFAATWFTDDDGSTYLTMSYGTNGFDSMLRCWMMKALDNTMTNWGAPFLIYSNTSNFGFDGEVVKSGSKYYLHYVRPGSNIKQATNNTLGSIFTDDGSFAMPGNTSPFEAPHFIQISGAHWRCYARYSHSGVREMYWDDSTNTFVNWNGFQLMTTVSNFWHGPGIMAVPAQATNGVYQLGTTNYGQINVVTPLLRANGVQAKSIYSSGGIVGNSVFAPTTITAGWMLQASGLNICLNSPVEGDLPPNFNQIAISAQNMTVSTNGDMRLNGNLEAGSVTADNVSASTLAAFNAHKDLTNAGLSSAFAFTANVLGLSAAATNVGNIASPGVIVTNGISVAVTVSNNFAVDAAHAFAASNSTALSLAAFDGRQQLTNAVVGTGLGFSAGRLYTTNLHVNLGQTTVLSTASGEVSLMDSVGTIPAGALKIGSVVRIDAYGTFLDAGNNSPSATFNLKLGSVNVATATGSPIGSVNWHLQAAFTVRTIASSGSVQGSVFLTVDNPASPFGMGSQTATVNTTIAQTVDVKGTIDDFTGGEAIKCDQLIVRVE